LTWSAVLLLALAPLGLVWAIAGQATTITIMSAMAVITLLAANCVYQSSAHWSAEPAARDEPPQVVSSVRYVNTPCVTVWVVAALVVVQLVAAGVQFFSIQFFSITVGQAVIALFIVLTAISLAVLNARRGRLRLAFLAEDDALISMIRGTQPARQAVGRLLVSSGERWTDILQALKQRLPQPTSKSVIVGFLESMLLRWNMALSLLLLLGLFIAWLAVT